MDTELQSPQTIPLSRRRLRSNHSPSSIPMLFHDTPCITKTSRTSTSPSITGLTSLETFPRHETFLKLRQFTGRLQDPSALRSCLLSTPSCFPNPMTVSSPFIPEEARRCVLCTSPLNYAFLRSSLFTIPFCVINGRIVSNPFYRRPGSGEFKQMSAR